MTSRGPIAIALLLAGAGCDAPGLDPSAPAAYVERVDAAARLREARANAPASFIAACPRPESAPDSSTVITLDGSPRLTLRLPAGFRRSGARQPTPTMVRFEGPSRALLLVERDPATVIGFGPAYPEATDVRRPFCALAARSTRVLAQFIDFTPRSGVVEPTGAGAAANVRTLLVDGAPIGLAVYATTPAERNALAALAARIRPAEP